jgi:hypothetical protein
MYAPDSQQIVNQFIQAHVASDFVSIEKIFAEL